MEPGKKEIPMNAKNPVNRIGASLLITLAIIGLTYLLLPNGRSVGAAPQPPQSLTSNNTLAASVPADQTRARTALGQLPLSFEMNRGQSDSEVQFASRGAGYKAFFTQSETVFVLRKPSAQSASQISANERSAIEQIDSLPREQRSVALKQLRREQAAQHAASRAVVRMSFVEGNTAAPVTGLDELPGKINYFRGNNQAKWVTDV